MAAEEMKSWPTAFLLSFLGRCTIFIAIFVEASWSIKWKLHIYSGLDSMDRWMGGCISGHVH